MKVYFISGLAADSRVFTHICLPVSFDKVYLDWIKPIINESLESYALRLATKIDTTEKFAVVGFSMGGMIAAEIAKKYKPVATILVSSASTCKEFPFHFKIARSLRLHKLIPAQFFKSASLLKRLFSSESATDKIILRQVIRDSDPAFIRWALKAILDWRNERAPEFLWHIHGTNDEILPVRNTNPTHTIHKGTHQMVLSRATEINKFLGEVLADANV